jgi:hypothetical protein
MALLRCEDAAFASQRAPEHRIGHHAHEARARDHVPMCRMHLARATRTNHFVSHLPQHRRRVLLGATAPASILGG